MIYLYDYIGFVAKMITILLGFGAFLFILLLFKKLASGDEEDPKIVVRSINRKVQQLEEVAFSEMMSEKGYKKYLEEVEERESKNKESDVRPSLFVLQFDGDIAASAVEQMREQISLVVRIAKPEDKVLLKLESPGGLVHAYGLAASQLARLRRAKIHLTIAVDQVAASGGYMMACLADRLVAAPFAVVGSVGVIGSVPNVSRLLKKYDIDYEEHTAGQHKRSLTVFGENTDEDRQQFKEDLARTHELFKAHIREARPQLDVDSISTGETWYGTEALSLKLIDEIGTSDDLILESLEAFKVYEVKEVETKTLADKLKSGLVHLLMRSL